MHGLAEALFPIPPCVRDNKLMSRICIINSLCPPPRVGLPMSVWVFVNMCECVLMSVWVFVGMGACV